jgi:hypothetical protein
MNTVAPVATLNLSYCATKLNQTKAPLAPVATILLGG